MKHISAFTFSLFLSLLAAQSAFAEKRVALVIGNSAYKHTEALRNPKNDANNMTTVLKRLGFEVLGGTDLTRHQFVQSVVKFSHKLRSADVGLFFYAGHGIQVSGQNYLVPIDAKLSDEADLQFAMVKLNDVLVQMERSRKTNLIFIDACRDNPLARSLARAMNRGGRSRSSAIGRGLAPVHSKRSGTMITFATEPGNVAQDGKGKNSPFTTAILKYIETQGQDIAPFLRRVRRDVIEATKGLQVPWNHSSLTEGFYFKEGQPLQQTPNSSKSGRDLSVAGVIFDDCNGEGWCPSMVIVPKGSFMMGSEKNAPPVHRVVIAKPFAVGRFEVTWHEWEACVLGGGCNGYTPKDEGWGKNNRPVINVSWEDAKAYVKWLSHKTKNKYRLMSEAEWEYAARAKTQTPFWWGKRASNRYANLGKKFCCDDPKAKYDYWEHTAPVGSFAANDFGLHDVIGNVWEWVEGCGVQVEWSSKERDSRPIKAGVRVCSLRQRRGGSWGSDPDPKYTSVAIDDWNDSDYRFYTGGFRVARSLP